MQEIGPKNRWSWVEINLSALRRNVRTFKKLLNPSVRLMCVVKADAYGHGAAACARAMSSAGANQFAVATVDEGIALRKSGITQPIVLLSEPPETAIDDLIEYSLIPTIYTTEFVLAYGERCVAHNTVGKYHMALDTGMTRVGVAASDAVEFRHTIDFHRGISCIGTSTHFATADIEGDWDFRRQYQVFSDAIRELHAAGFYTGLIHCNSTAATILHPELQFDMCRVGIGLYGLHPSEATVSRLELSPVMSVKARVVRAVEPRIGDGVSYGMTYRVSDPHLQIATIPLGYADGLSRSLSNKMDVLVKGQRVHQVGRICMDQCMFAYPLQTLAHPQGFEPIERGDVATVLGEDGAEYISADELATLRNTINYEVLCDFSLRLERVYL